MMRVDEERTLPGTCMMACSNCRGYGVVTGAGGGPITCSVCGGNSVLRSRDQFGRFLPFRPTNEQETP